MTAPTLFDQTPAAGLTIARPAAVSTPPLVIGLDLSLTCTGVAGVGWTDIVRTKRRGDARLHYLATAVGDFIKAADMVVMEGPSFGHGAMAGHEELAGLRILVRQYCYRHRIPYGVVPPSSLKMFATGRGNATKGEVRSGVADRYGHHTEGVGRYDQADAYTALAMGLHHLGHPLAEAPERALKALAGCAWPETVAVAA
ncbi:hypothetical protein C5F59_027675 [Streptomyces sp. QL37]|uniref:hypothetical protein n=1 Tax=Streptomyces sp. QL37 TaxID=2093747 RepID=UPI000CF25EC4|nr:hypothetical protein [Streptomyces sp. QL37]PPQ57110.1 hypothetical protein C5F59_10770 [Streptomyces sp. QL37]